MKYTSDSFKAIKDGAQVEGRLIEDCGSAAKVFAQRLANRHGKRRAAIVNPDSYGASSAGYWVTILAPGGVVDDTQYMVVTVED